MAKLTRKRPATISHDLKFRGQGEEFELHVEYNNITWEELQSAFDPNDKTTLAWLPKLVKSWDAEFPITVEGGKEIEDLFPGVLPLVIQGFHQARTFELAKN